MSTWTKRFRIALKNSNMTQEELAQKMGISRSSIVHYFSGRRTPPIRQFQKLAAALKIDPAWLQFGTETAEIKNKKIIERYPLPILSLEQASEFVDITKIKRDEISEFLPHFYTDKSKWYGLRVQGDAMISASGHSKSFHEGEIIIIDPDKKAVHGDFVIVLLPRSKKITFRQYVIDSGVKYLKPLNPQYPLTQFEQSTHIVGVAVMSNVSLVSTVATKIK